VKTIVDGIKSKLDEIGEKVIGTEGYSEGNWVLVDSADVVAHIFYEPFRGFYDIESMWIDAPRIELSFLESPPKNSPPAHDTTERYG
jgi:ribosome-associated protein